MTKKLFTVRIEHVVVVVADNQSEALELADNALRSGLLDINEDDMHVKPLSCLDAGWTLDCFPYGDSDEEKTIGDWIKEGAAPEYTKLQERLRGVKHV